MDSAVLKAPRQIPSVLGSETYVTKTGEWPELETLRW